VNMFSN